MHGLGGEAHEDSGVCFHQDGLPSVALAEYERTSVVDASAIKWRGRSCSGGGQHSHLVSEGSGVGSLA